MDSEKLMEEAIKFADDIEGVENHEICPLLSIAFNKLTHCRKDCELYCKKSRECVIKQFLSYFSY